ncbi:hypothetical protein J6590_020083 [Homalodisca vitripennis]|nr:hypothetical protein J6590_020083 [Homalodisca vitripennis]
MLVCCENITSEDIDKLRIKCSRTSSEQPLYRLQGLNHVSAARGRAQVLTFDAVVLKGILCRGRSQGLEGVV